MQTNSDEPSELPFQLVVKYTDREGATALRVLTQCKEFTYDRREAEKGKGTKEEIKGTKDNTCTCLSFDLYILMELLSKKKYNTYWQFDFTEVMNQRQMYTLHGLLTNI